MNIFYFTIYYIKKKKHFAYLFVLETVANFEPVIENKQMFF